jgi:hypothetical protein
MYHYIIFLPPRQASNIANLIVSAQVLDRFVAQLAGKSLALDYGQFPKMRISVLE